MAGREGLLASIGAWMRIPNVLCGKISGFSPDFSSKFRDEEVDMDIFMNAPTLQETQTPWWDGQAMSTKTMQQYVMPASATYTIEELMFVCQCSLFGWLRPIEHWGTVRCCRELSICRIPNKDDDAHLLGLPNHWSDLCEGPLGKTLRHYDSYSNAMTFYHSDKAAKRHRAESMRGNLHRVLDNALIQWGQHR